MARFLGPADRLSLLVLAGFALATAVYGRHPAPTLALVFALAALLVAFAAWGSRSHARRVAHDFLAPYVSVALLFELSGRVVAAVGAPHWDARLAALDARWFPALALGWHDLLGRPVWLTDFAGAAYVSFYLFPLAVGLAIFVRRPRWEFHRFAFATEAAFFLPYLGYVATPALGPRGEADLGSASVARLAHAFVGQVELNSFDAFPSGHTAVALVVAALGARAFPRWSVPIAFVAGSIVFSTVYLSYHYVVDVVAGAAVACALPVVLPLLERACGLRVPRKAFALRAKTADVAR